MKTNMNVISMDEIHAPAALAIMLLFIAAYAIVIDSEINISVSETGQMIDDNLSYPPCTNGSSQECAIGVCKGTQECMDGQWTLCALSKTCIPGSLAPCSDTVCTQSLKKCDECGSGYSPCFNNSGEVG